MNFLISILIWTLALYGLFEIVKNIIYLTTYTKLNSDGLYFIIAAKNQENRIECFFRTILFKIIYGREENIKNIFFIDLNSKDKTKKIVENLEDEYSEIKILNLKDCMELLENLKQ